MFSGQVYVLRDCNNAIFTLRFRREIDYLHVSCDAVRAKETSQIGVDCQGLDQRFAVAQIWVGLIKSCVRKVGGIAYR